jgi:hypothetical protein
MSSSHLKITIKEKKERGDNLPSATMLSKALYTLNFKNCTNQELTPAGKHWGEASKATLSQVLWKDVTGHMGKPQSGANVGLRACLCFP